MKKIGIRIAALVLAVMLCATGVFAAESAITFEGTDKGFAFQSDSQYTETDLFGNFKDVMPGDRLTEMITFTNQASDCDYIRLYMRAVVHDEAENPLTYSEAYESEDGKDQSGISNQRDETVATMSDFLAQLYMRVYSNGTLIYEASPDQTDGLTEDTFLGIYRTGETASLKVELEVPGELDNRYASRVGEVDWVFVAEAFDDPEPSEDHTFLTVHKVWQNCNSEEIPDSIEVQLLKDGEVTGSVALNEENQWAYTWDQLDEGCTWTVREVVPEGYTAAYFADGNVVTIVNTAASTPPVTPSEPVDMTVKKQWAGDEDILDKRPSSVGVTLFNGETAVETVYLGDWNDWTYTWKALDGSGNWSVLEVDVPKNYKPSYSVSGNVVTITNTASLIDTGQLNWPVPVLFGLGLMMILLGAALTKRKRDHG